MNCCQREEPVAGGRVDPSAAVTGVLFLVAIFLAFVARPTTTAQRAPSTVDDADMYEVYNAVLQNHISVREFKDLRATGLVIREDTATYSHCFPRGKSPDSDWSEMEADYNQQNAVPRKLLQNRFRLELPVLVAPSADIMGLFNSEPSDGYRRFIRKFPSAKGWIDLSAVGFNKRRTHAFLYVAHYCGGLCGQGGYQFMEKKSGVWIRATMPNVLSGCMWIS